VKVPICSYCRHFRPTTEGAFCDAFPDGDGVPDAILYEDELHFEPYPGDHGIQFEPADEETAQFVERAFGRRFVAGRVASR
jgi:hypothetical protein